MAEELRKLPACGFCWDHKRRCDRTSASLECRECKSYISQDKLENDAFQKADTFFDTVAHGDLYRGARIPSPTLDRISSLPTLDINLGSRDRNILGLQITTSAGKTSDPYKHEIDAPFNTKNPTLLLWLDRIARENFSLNIHGQGPHTEVIENTILIGSLMQFLCSASRVIEVVETTRDVTVVPNEMEQYNIHIHLQYFIFDRIRTLMEETLNTICFEDGNIEDPEKAPATHAAAVILRYEVDYFKRNLRNDSIFQDCLIPSAWKGPGSTLVKWFTDIEAKLQLRICQGCSQHVYWDTALSSKKRARRELTTFELKLTLRQIKYTVPKAPPPQAIYTTLGHGDVFLTLPPTSPTLKVLGLSSDALDVERKIPVHVSYPALLYESSTGADTSDEDLDLFPDFDVHTLAG